MFLLIFLLIIIGNVSQMTLVVHVTSQVEQEPKLEIAIVYLCVFVQVAKLVLV